MSRGAGATAFTLGLLLLTGCTATVAPVADSSQVAPSGTADSLAFHLPVEAYIVSGLEAHTYNVAQGILTNQCMVRFGFDPDPDVPPFSAAAAIMSSFTARRYLLLDEEQARTVGYDLRLLPVFQEQAKRRKERAAEAKANAGTDPNRLAARARILNGDSITGSSNVPDGGCIGEANRALRGTNEGLSWSQTAIELQNESYDRSLTDERVKAAFAAWSACMTEAGFTYPTPVEANNDPAWRGDTPSSREIATATADVECKQRTNLVGVWSDVETGIQRGMIDKHATELQEARDADVAALAKAAAVAREAGR